MFRAHPDPPPPTPTPTDTHTHTHIHAHTHHPHTHMHTHTHAHRPPHTHTRTHAHTANIPTNPLRQRPPTDKKQEDAKRRVVIINGTSRADLNGHAAVVQSGADVAGTRGTVKMVTGECTGAKFLLRFEHMKPLAESFGNVDKMMSIALSTPAKRLRLDGRDVFDAAQGNLTTKMLTKAYRRSALLDHPDKGKCSAAQSEPRLSPHTYTIFPIFSAPNLPQAARQVASVTLRTHLTSSSPRLSAPH